MPSRTTDRAAPFKSQHGLSLHEDEVILGLKELRRHLRRLTKARVEHRVVVVIIGCPSACCTRGDDIVGPALNVKAGLRIVISSLSNYKLASSSAPREVRSLFPANVRSSHRSRQIRAPREEYEHDDDDDEGQHLHVVGRDRHPDQLQRRRDRQGHPEQD